MDHSISSSSLMFQPNGRDGKEDALAAHVHNRRGDKRASGQALRGAEHGGGALGLGARCPETGAKGRVPHLAHAYAGGTAD